MKNLRTSLACLCMSLCSLSVFGQKADTNDNIPLNQPDYNKPKLFSNLPDQIPVELNDFTSILSNKKGNAVEYKFNNTIRIEGEVISTSDAAEKQFSSVVVRSSNYPGAVMTITKVTDEAGKISYTGRIISMKHGDLFELQQKDGQYIFVKRTFHELINE